MLLLLPERAAFWEAAGTLLIADPHFGKTATFRGAGLAVPGGTTEGDLVRLSGALERCGARRLAVLGDFFHARQGRAAQVLAALAAWRERHAALEVVLVRGNHDRHAGAPPAGLNIACVEPPLREAPFALAHHPDPVAGAYLLAGHLHPAVVLRGAARQRERLPCFWFGAEVGVLPAFGGFTGMAEVRPRPGDRVWVVAEGETLRTTALVHEAYLKQIPSAEQRWESRAHFFAVAARAMRQVLVDTARRRQAKKRGGGELLVSLEEGIAAPMRSEKLLALDEALARLALRNPRWVRIVEHRFFAGMTAEETAGVMEISLRTVEREWRAARAWLTTELYGGDGR